MPKRKLLVDTHCRKCNVTIQVPIFGAYSVECGSCGHRNIVFSTIPPKGGSKGVMEAPVAAPPKSAPPPPEVVEVEEEAVEETVEETVEEEAVEDELPEWNPKMLKAELLEIAQEAGLDVTEKNTKVQIVEALRGL
jgi:hypothetical protein